MFLVKTLEAFVANFIDNRSFFVSFTKRSLQLLMWNILFLSISNLFKLNKRNIEINLRKT